MTVYDLSTNSNNIFFSTLFDILQYKFLSYREVLQVLSESSELSQLSQLSELIELPEVFSSTEKCLLHQALRPGDLLLELRLASKSSETSRSSGTSQSPISSCPVFPDVGNPSHPVLQVGCHQNKSAEPMSLHTSSLSPNSFFLSLTSPSTHNPLQPFHALLDSGSSHSFVDEAFVIKNKIMFSYLPNPIPLRMFDRSTPSNVNKKVQMPIIFPTGEMHHLELELFVTKLDENYSLALGYNWLAWYNPSINWT